MSTPIHLPFRGAAFGPAGGELRWPGGCAVSSSVKVCDRMGSAFGPAGGKLCWPGGCMDSSSANLFKDAGSAFGPAGGEVRWPGGCVVSSSAIPVGRTGLFARPVTTGAIPGVGSEPGPLDVGIEVRFEVRA